MLAITEVSYLDASGPEQLRVSRLAMDVIGSRIDYSQDPQVPRGQGRPHLLRPGVLPQGVRAVHDHRHAAERAGGVTVAEVNLKFIWDVVSQIKVGKAGLAYVVDGSGALIAHPDISLVLQKTDLASLTQVKAAAGARAPATATVADRPRSSRAARC